MKIREIIGIFAFQMKIYTPLFLFTIIIGISCAHVKPTAVYENARLKKDVILYNNGKILLVHKKAEHDFEFATGHFNFEDSALYFRNEITPTQFSFKMNEENDPSNKQFSFKVAFDLPGGSAQSFGKMEFYFIVNDSFQLNLTIDSAKSGMIYGVSDTRITHVRGVQLFETNSCFSSQRYLVKDSSSNQVVVRFHYMPDLGNYKNYIWGSIRTGILSPSGDSLLLNMSSCGTISARTDTLIKMQNLKPYKKWPVKILPESVRKDFLYQGN
ncbi:MAG TPA: hypothetical protein VL651_01305 [Bacteroidia bacterium]|jgi:hypothetical protein|nr:hypothetical protein [Bacteroidia bacterium]